MQLQRLFEIVYILLQRKKVTAKELAEHFEVSTRTIYRDLDALSMAGIPLYTNKGHQGGIFLMDNYVLQRSLFSEAEQQELLAALQSYHIADKEDSSALLQKLSATFSAKLTNWIDVEFRGWENDAAMDVCFNKSKQPSWKSRFWNSPTTIPMVSQRIAAWNPCSCSTKAMPGM